MTRRAVGVALEAGTPALAFLLWWRWSVGAESFFFPPVPEILRSFADTWLFERVSSDVVPSLARLAVGYAIAVVLGIGLGTVLGRSQLARRATAPLVEFMRAIPPVALIPFGLVVLGIGNEMKIFIITFVCLWPVLLNTIDGVAGLDPTLDSTSRIYGIKGLRRLWLVVLPWAAPQIFAGMRTALSLSLIMMVVSEMVASTNGIGYFVVQSQRSFAIPEMWAGILLLGLLGYALNVLFVLLEARVLRWHRESRAGAT